MKAERELERSLGNDRTMDSITGGLGPLSALETCGKPPLLQRFTEWPRVLTPVHEDVPQGTRVRVATGLALNVAAQIPEGKTDFATLIASAFWNNIPNCIYNPQWLSQSLVCCTPINRFFFFKIRIFLKFLGVFLLKMHIKNNICGTYSRKLLWMLKR